MSSSELTVNQAGPADLIASVWYTLGFRPLNSLVLIALHGPRGRVGSMLRIDLTPAWFGPDGVSDVLDAAVESVTGPGAAAFAGVPPGSSFSPGVLPLRVVAVVATADALIVPAPQVIRALPHRLLRAGVWVYDLIGVTPTTYRSLTCPDEDCCPAAGRPLSEVESSRVAVAHVMRGERLADSEHDVIGDVGEPVAESLDEMSSEADELDPADADDADGGAGDGAGDEAAAERRRRRWWRTFNALLGRVEGWDTDRLGVAELGDSYLRDAVFVRLAATPGVTRVRLLHQLLAGQAPPDLTEHWGTLFTGPPDRELFARGEEVLAALARRGTAAERGPVLAVLALLAWYRGNGVRTRLLMERLRSENPVLPDELPRLAGLVETLCATGTAPPWVELSADGPGSGPAAQGWAG
ncbi:DUF4192 domain-containing protein [Kineosporia babensis]|uniref:DUF4192 domain-containing protein n=1 Tax=Kineosporia babensis TaxID=499548 RepID=A0A9X1SVY3_9ACTN|nr:DUF4192 domain-containing protein [Kineosporia babensis]MCD5314171.1 DUF4192 domain-containing protein [Kineosporia babensis]